jgi:hypothetical protein
MQNSKLSTIIFPKLAYSWNFFIQRVEEELNSIKLNNKNNANMVKELRTYIAKIKEIKRKCSIDILEIFNYRVFLPHVDSSVEKYFKALDILKERNNLDNDVVKTLYDNIINSPGIVSLNEKYNNLAFKNSFIEAEVKHLEELIDGKRYNLALIQDLLDKFVLPDEIKKDVLLYGIIMNSQDHQSLNNKKSNNKSFHDKFMELCDKYDDKKSKIIELLSNCYDIVRKMSSSEISLYKGYAYDDTIERIEDDKLSKVMAMMILKQKKDIEDYIESISELETEGVHLNGEIAYFKDLLNNFDKVIDKFQELNYDIKKERNIFYALDPFNRLIPNKDLLSNFKNNIKELFKKCRNVKISDDKEIEDLLKKNVNVININNYLLSYIEINNNILLLSITESDDNKPDKWLTRLIKRNIIPLKKQINLIEEMNKDYIELQREINEEL